MIGLLLAVAKFFLGTAQKISGDKAAVEIEKIKAGVEDQKARLEQVRIHAGNPIIRFAAGIMAMATAIYFAAIVVDTIFTLPGDINELPATTAAVMATVIGGMFLSRK